MSTLVLIRHGQASFLGKSYDRLSELGAAQARALAQHWLATGERFDHVYTGTLTRQADTARIVSETYRDAGAPFPQARTHPGLDEYPAERLVRAVLPRLRRRDRALAATYAEFRSASDPGARARHLQTLLEAVIAAWLAGTAQARGLPSWAEFHARTRAAFDTLIADHAGGQRVAAFSSGGTISVFVQTVLEAPERKAIELSWRLLNCSLTQLSFSNGRISLDHFNAVPHLTRPEQLTYR